MSDASEATQIDDLSVDDSRRSRRAAILKGVEQYSVVGVFIAIFVVFASLLPTFRSSANVHNMINSQSVILMLAVAGSIPLRCGEFDLSIASVMVASAAVVARMTAAGDPVILAVVIALALGLVVGLLNAFLIVILDVNSFIATLGVLTGLEGATYAITNSQIVAGVSTPILNFARGMFLGFPAATWYGWIFVVIAWYVYEHTPLGRYLLFIGGNPNAARLAGLRVTRIRFATFVSCSVLSAFVGIVLAGQLGAIDPSIAPQYLLPPFAAIYLGATTIKLGRINAIGILIAVYLLVEGITGLQLYGAASWVTDVFNGGALVFAVSLARVLGRQTR